MKQSSLAKEYQDNKEKVDKELIQQVKEGDKQALWIKTVIFFFDEGTRKYRIQNHLQINGFICKLAM